VRRVDWPEIVSALSVIPDGSVIADLTLDVDEFRDRTGDLKGAIHQWELISEQKLRDSEFTLEPPPPPLTTVMSPAAEAPASPKSPGPISIIGIISAVYATLIASLIYAGWCLTILWGWFITPLGVPAIETYQGVGITLIVAMTFGRLLSSFARKPSEELLSKGFGSVFARALTEGFGPPSGALLLGFIVRALFS
jgi:hypothetical protein